ncbi:MAG: hypothetical protein ACE5G0_14890 [Rhodothermales bacterium]
MTGDLTVHQAWFLVQVILVRMLSPDRLGDMLQAVDVLLETA